jgi:hypothetical protein
LKLEFKVPIPPNKKIQLPQNSSDDGLYVRKLTHFQTNWPPKNVFMFRGKEDGLCSNLGDFLQIKLREPIGRKISAQTVLQNIRD